MTYFWIPLAAIVPGFFLWAIVHEAAHAAAGRLTGREVLRFRPYPHKLEGGRFVFASVSFNGDPGTFSHVAPYVVDAVAFAGAAVGFWLVGHPAALWGLATAAGLPLVNSTVGVWGRYRAATETVDLLRVSWGRAAAFFWLLVVYYLVVGAMILRLLSL